MNKQKQNLETLVDLSNQATTPVTTTYIRLHRTRVTHLLPAVEHWYRGPGTEPYRHFNDGVKFNRYAFPVTKPMALVQLSLSNIKGDPRYISGDSTLGLALEIGYRSAAEWVSELCPQYTGFPVYEVEDDPSDPLKVIATARPNGGS